ncbi:hypothetical protein GTQ40_09470 [Flavobacteriaceae bacterium R38]|nr:hypothetical protein [Flavobacteriaceae bacterium R38]
MKTPMFSDEYNELCYYTLGHPDKNYFIHQHFVDAYQLQNADQNTKPIGIIFALIGLYLFLEKDYSGKRVQLAHMEMAKNKKEWPKIELPKNRGDITISDVLNTEAGQARNLMIKKWCVSVWKSYQNNHKTIAALAKTALNLS